MERGGWMGGATAAIERGEDASPGERAPAGGCVARVCMLTALFPPSIGGIQSHTLRLGQKLAERGVAVHVVTRLQPGLAAFERMGGVRVHRVGVARARGAAGSLAFVAEGVRAVLRLARHVDVLHAHQLLSPSTVGLVAAPLARLPLIVNPHACGDIGDVGQLSRSALGRARLLAVVRRADAFVAVSRPIRDELLGAGAPPQRVWSIANGVDTDRFSPAPAAERAMIRRALGLADGPLVVYTGRLAPEKGVDLLLEAWPAVRARSPAARLAILGAGPEEARLRELARARGVAPSVDFVGGLPDVAPHLRAADVAVLPSRTEGMPVALLEAMSCGLPVVATRVGGSAEVIEDEIAGRLVAPEDPAALAAGLAEALLDAGAAARRGAAARALVLARYGMDLVVDRMLELYRSVVASRAAPRTGASR
jgi:glycosyltransferase involved in cell wall biosynthesis